MMQHLNHWVLNIQNEIIAGILMFLLHKFHRFSNNQSEGTDIRFEIVRLMNTKKNQIHNENFIHEL